MFYLYGKNIFPDFIGLLLSNDVPVRKNNSGTIDIITMLNVCNAWCRYKAEPKQAGGDCGQK